MASDRARFYNEIVDVDLPSSPATAAPEHAFYMGARVAYESFLTALEEHGEVEACRFFVSPLDHARNSSKRASSTEGMRQFHPLTDLPSSLAQDEP